MSQYNLDEEIEIDVQFYDLDPMAVIWHGNYVKYFERARVALMEKIGFSYRVMATTDFFWPIVDIRLQYVRFVRVGTTILAKAELVEYEQRLKIRYDLRDKETGRRVCKGYSVQLAVHKQSGEMSFAMPQVLLNKIEKVIS